MAKNNSALQVVENKDIVPSEEFASWFMEDAGKGVSFSQVDNIVPLIYILQSGSKALKRSQPQYIEGAKAGDIWKRNSIHNPLVSGEEGILFQPCFFNKVWVEWRPNREGLAGVHPDCPIDGYEETVLHEGKERKVWMRKNGNYLVETRQHVGYVDNSEPYVIPFASSGHTISKQWMQMMSQMFLPGSSNVAPSFARQYRLTTWEKTNTQGSWHLFKVTDAGWVTDKEQGDKGRALHAAFTEGQKKVAQVEDIDATDDGYDHESVV